MKITDILSTLNYDYYPSEDDIIITWFDKNHTAQFLDVQPDPDVLTEAWSRIASDVQEELNHLVEHREFVHDIAEQLAEAIKDVEKEWNEDA
jgi:F0F1-type ATP synthase alpha subunit